MFAVDFYGNAEIIKSPFENGGTPEIYHKFIFPL